MSIKKVLMNKILFCVFTLISVSINAQDITTCQNPAGRAFYHLSGPITQSDSGWQEDKITGGTFTLKKLSDGKFDILIIDSRKSIFSLRQDGGEVVLLRKGINDVTFLHFFPGMAIELYTFWRDSKGRFRFDMLQSKGGDGLKVHKSSVLVGECSPINFDFLK